MIKRKNSPNITYVTPEQMSKSKDAAEKLLGELLCQGKKVKPPRKTEEYGTQKSFFKWLHLWDKEIVKFTFHIPNGGSRDIREARNLKAMGVTPGVPDVFCAMPAYGYNGLFIEFKSKNGNVSQTQEKMIEGLSSNGYKVVICHDWIEAKELMEWYEKGRGRCLTKDNSGQK